jgi:hypothetical protein
MNEPGLYDYVIFNEKLEEAFQQLTIIAQRALDGQVGNGTGQGPVTLVPDDYTGVPNGQVCTTRDLMSLVLIEK